MNHSTKLRRECKKVSRSEQRSSWPENDMLACEIDYFMARVREKAGRAQSGVDRSGPSPGQLRWLAAAARRAGGVGQAAVPRGIGGERRESVVGSLHGGATVGGARFASSAQRVRMRMGKARVQQLIAGVSQQRAPDGRVQDGGAVHGRRRGRRREEARALDAGHRDERRVVRVRLPQHQLGAKRLFGA